MTHLTLPLVHSEYIYCLSRHDYFKNDVGLLIRVESTSFKFQYPFNSTLYTTKLTTKWVSALNVKLKIVSQHIIIV